MTTQTTETTTQAEGFRAAAAASAEAETERKQAGRPPRRFVEKIPCKLTPDDIVKIAREIEQADTEAAKLEDERKSVNDGFKARISLAEQRRSDLIAKVRSETEMRDVELVEEFHFSNNSVRVIRTDTMEPYRERAMTRGERQEELPLPKVETKTDEKVEAAPDSGDGTAITEPQTILDSASGDEQEDEDTSKPKKTKRVRRGRK